MRPMSGRRSRRLSGDPLVDWQKCRLTARLHCDRRQTSPTHHLGFSHHTQRQHRLHSTPFRGVFGTAQELRYLVRKESRPVKEVS